MSDFTKGPWSVNRHQHIDDELWLTVLAGAWDITSNSASMPGVVADAKYSAMSDKENLANAHLIAAAPEMYEALLKAREFITNGVELGYIKLPDPDGLDSALKTLPLIQTVIVKARGEI